MQAATLAFVRQQPVDSVRCLLSCCPLTLEGTTYPIIQSNFLSFDIGKLFILIFSNPWSTSLPFISALDINFLSQNVFLPSLSADAVSAIWPFLLFFDQGNGFDKSAYAVLTQKPLDKLSNEVTTFNTPFGLFQCDMLSFGLGAS